jgi:hypothetical protein
MSMIIRACLVALLLAPLTGCDDPPEPPAADASADGGSRAEGGSGDGAAREVAPGDVGDAGVAGDGALDAAANDATDAALDTAAGGAGD